MRPSDFSWSQWATVYEAALKYEREKQAAMIVPTDIQTFISRTYGPRREADEPKVTADVAAYLSAWFCK